MLKLVHSNDISVNYSENYEDAIDFLCKSFPEKFANLRVMSQNDTVKLMNRLCDDYIDNITEKDNGKCLYKIRIKR